MEVLDPRIVVVDASLHPLHCPVSALSEPQNVLVMLQTSSSLFSPVQIPRMTVEPCAPMALGRRAPSAERAKGGRWLGVCGRPQVLTTRLRGVECKQINIQDRTTPDVLNRTKRLRNR